MPRRPPNRRPRPSPAPRPRVRPGRRRSRAALAAALGVLLAIPLGVAVWASRPSAEPTPTPTSAKPGPIGPFAPAADPRDPAAWLRQIDRLRAEGRAAEAAAVGWSALGVVAPRGRPEILRALTLALLADVPDDQARRALRDRIEADPDDLDARVALARLAMAGEDAPASDRPRAGRDPGGRGEEGAADELEALLEQAPGHLGARAALAEAMLDVGRIDRARPLLDSWPEGRRDDPDRLRLRARIDLDHDARPDRAAEALGRLVADAPHDWRLRARLARALARSGDPEGARAQAAMVDRLRERLAPDRLGPRLARGLGRLDDPTATADLAALCDAVGLAELAAAWRREAGASAGSPGPGGEAGETGARQNGAAPGSTR